MTALQLHTIELGRLILCGECGIRFAFDSEIHDRRLKDGKTFYCPNGHGRVYADTEAKRLKRKLEARDRQLERARLDAQSARKATASEKRRHSATKGQVTKLKKRASAGVCPCCNRTFKQLARHMEGQHPEYAEQARKAGES